jgi:hypothetical protein
LDLTTGRIAPLLDEAVTGFFWSPQGDALVYVTVDTQRSHLRWHRLARPSGETTELARFLPSREQTFVFSFFDQYASSHSPLAPNGSALAFAGYLLSSGQLDTTARTQVYMLALDPLQDPQPIAPGSFVCWNTV